MKHRSSELDMLHGPLAGKLLRFTLPIALSSIVQQLFNAADTAVTADVEGDFDFGEMLRVVQMKGALSDCNTAEEPEKIVPVEVAPTAARTVELPPHSFSVLIFRK